MGNEMKITEARISGVLVFEAPVYRDHRGYFQEAFRREFLEKAGVDLDWKQDNLSVSAPNVVRGLHYQLVRPQAKLIQVVHGAAFDVIVDIRMSSPTYGEHITFDLKAGDGKSVLIPAGFAHGFAALEPDTAFLYKVSESYLPEGDRTILWNDPELGIPWPISEAEAIVSEKDRRGAAFLAAEVFP
jgi:dTDP-4-dehydrorhamnose 3,5-epimerase